ncbi:hypothetical protein BJI67_05410 [Acidihalobacter aeolianus]|uniref:Uncharacterized protein n=1 Tax=Acidihalobacter aeolianus TaxID=2792603 RepID=A0A1D8K6H6_9GAMM|nr:hypothetical protein [Acidihalobacter aeolianus]AOV16582.1 hypothetical protein BJI67_05410 [Acidihalobacter aeolianus]
MTKKVVSIQTLERRKKAVELRKAGLSYAKIGERLGIARQSAFAHVRHVLSELQAETAESAEQVRQIELERLDRATELCMRGIENGELAAIDRLIRIQERRARLLGLDAVERLDIGTQPLPSVIYCEPVSPAPRE